MASRAVNLPNSLTGQIELLTNDFAAVEQAATNFEVHQVRSTALLHDALATVYAFGERILNLPTQDGRSIIEEFLIGNKISFNARVRLNPYIGLVKLAFQKTSESSRSQYSTVLNYAFKSEVTPKHFKAWISDGGVEGRRDQAVAENGSTVRKQNDQKKVAAAKRARAALESRERSAPVALPAHIKAPEGFAILLARVDGTNTAEIIELIQTDADKLDAQLIALVNEGPQPQAATGPLGSFFRALDLITRTTPAKTDGEPRDILICNTVERGSPVAFIAATSGARSFPGARIKLSGFVGELPQDQSFILKAAHADFLLSIYGKHDDWKINDVGAITGGGLPQPINLTHLKEAGAYRVSIINTATSKTFAASDEQLKAVAAYIKQEREAHTRRNQSRKDAVPFSSTITLSHDEGNLFVKLPQSMLTATLADTTSEIEADDCVVLTSELERIAETLSFYNLQVTGGILGTDVANAAITFEALLDDDQISIVLPTRIGGNYNQVCEGVLV